MLKEILENLEVTKIITEDENTVKITEKKFKFSPASNGLMPIMSKKISRAMKNFIEKYIEKDYYIVYNVETSDRYIISSEDVAKLGISNDLNSGKEVQIGDSKYVIDDDYNITNTVGLIEVDGEEVEKPQTPKYKDVYLKYEDLPALLVTTPFKKGKAKLKPNNGDLYCGYYKKNVFSGDVTYTLVFYTDKTIEPGKYIILNPKVYAFIEDIEFGDYEQDCKELDNVRVNVNSSTMVVKKILT